MSDKKRKVPAKAPVSAHRAFPAIVALWFAALFGIGSLVLPIALYERTAEATGLASLVTAAQAPLGVNARIFIALVAAALGAVGGLEIARKVAAANAPRPMARRAKALSPVTAAEAPSSKRPISAHEELGEGGFDAPAPAATGARRRALSVTEEGARSDFLEFAPLPGHGESHAEEPAALDLGAFAADGPVADEPAVTEADAAMPIAAQTFAEPEHMAVFGSGGLSDPPIAGYAPQVFVPSAPAPAATPAPQPETRETEDFAMTPFQPAATAPFAAPSAAPHVTARIEPVSALPEPPAFAPVMEAAARPLAELGIAELVERFALALEGHRAAPRQAMPTEPPVMPVEAAEAAEIPDHAPATFAELEPFAPAVPTAFEVAPPVPHIPLSLRPVGFDDEDESEEDALPDLDLTAALSRSNRAFAAPPVPQPFVAEAAPPVPQAFVAEVAAPEPDADEGEEADEGYSSLLAMKSPFGLPREAVRIDDEDMGDDSVEPVVIFPGQATRGAATPAADGPARDAGFAAVTPGVRPFDAPQDRIDALGQPDAAVQAATRAASGDTERALREALEKLQRMSGAA